MNVISPMEKLQIQANYDEESDCNRASIIIDHKYDFKLFLEHRDKEKFILYSSVMTFGLMTCFYSSLIGIVNFTVWYSTAIGSLLYNIGMTFSVVASCTFMIGVLVVSTVPVDEFDMDSQLLFLYPWVIVTLKYLLGFIITVFGTLFSVFFPYIPGLILLLNGLWIICYNSHLSRDEDNTNIFNIFKNAKFTTRIISAGTIIFIPVSFIYCQLGIDPISISHTNLYFTNMWLGWTTKIASKSYVTLPIYVTVGLNYFLAGVVSTYYWYKMSFQRTPGWRTSVLYNQLHLWIMTTGINFIIINVFGSVYNFVVEDPAARYSNLIVSFSLILPIFILFFFGKKYFFTVIARYFELDIFRLQSDGAIMAELASSSQVVDLNSRIYWIKRNKDVTTYCNQLNCISRIFWMKGSIIDTKSQVEYNFIKHEKKVLYIKIDFAEDLDCTWDYKFKGIDYERISSVTPVQETKPVSKDSFESWLKQNFSSDQLFHVDTTNYIVIVKIIQADHNDHSDRHTLLDWAKNNLRQLDWKKFYDELLHVSPRMLGNLDDKIKIYNLSDPIIVNDSKSKIDFFISHSWEDNAAKKCSVLRSFVETFKKRFKKYPTFWCVTRNIYLFLLLKISLFYYFSILLGLINVASIKSILEMLYLFYQLILELVIKF